jgi:hypothetical protein
VSWLGSFSVLTCPGGLARGIAHLKKRKKVPGKTFCRDPQFRFVVETPGLVLKNRADLSRTKIGAVVAAGIVDPA